MIPGVLQRMHIFCRGQRQTVGRAERVAAHDCSCAGATMLPQGKAGDPAAAEGPAQ